MYQDKLSGYESDACVTCKLANSIEQLMTKDSDHSAGV